jgi:hypothetical protein
MPAPPERIESMPLPSQVLGIRSFNGKHDPAANTYKPYSPGLNDPANPEQNKWLVPPPEAMVESGKQLADGFNRNVKLDGQLLDKLKPGEYGDYFGEGQQFRVEPDGKSGKGKKSEGDSPLEVTITNTAEELFGADFAKGFGEFSKNIGKAVGSGGNIGGNVMSVAGNALAGAASTGIGNLTRDLFKSIGFFKYGGEIGEDDMNIPVQHFSVGGLAGANIAGYDSRAIDAAMRAEGGASAGAMLAVVHRGERVLSDLTGDAQLYQDMLLSGEWSQRRSGHSPDYVSNFAFGGSVGNTASNRSGGGSGKGSIVHQDNSTTFIINSDKSAMDEFRRSQDQIQLQQARNAARAKNYNG